MVTAGATYFNRKNALVGFNLHHVKSCAGFLENVSDQRYFYLRKIMSVNDHNRPKRTCAKTVCE